MLAAARHVVVLADHTKFGQDHFARFGDLADIDVVITDDGLSADDADQLRAAGRGWCSHDALPSIAGPAQLVVTLTANPSLDRTADLPALIRARCSAWAPRADGCRRQGRERARALHAAGVSVRTVLPAGGPSGDELLRLLAAEGIDADAVRVGQPIRSNLTLVEPGGRTTKLNEPGPDLAAHADELALSVMRAAMAADWVVDRRQPPARPGPEFYTDLIAALHDAGRKGRSTATGNLQLILPSGRIS